MKLSPSQQKVIDLLKEGWELGIDSGWFPDARLQKNGLGKGGEVYRPTFGTINALRKRNLIVYLKTDRFTKIYIFKT